MLHLWSSSKYAIELPDGHRFPMSKYQLLREGVLAEGLVPPESAFHCPCVTSVCPMKKLRERVTLCCVSSVPWPTSPEGEPIVKVPAGM